MSIGAPPQKWCEQTQPHGPHVWVEEKGMYGMYMSCAGYLNIESQSNSHYAEVVETHE